MCVSLPLQTLFFVDVVIVDVPCMCFLDNIIVIVDEEVDVVEMIDEAQSF